MKTVKAWAIVDEDGIQPELIFKKRSEAVKTKLIGNSEKVVRVEIRDLKKKARRNE